MSFSSILTPREEILKGSGIQGVIDLENLRLKKKKTLECSPKDFFDITYPTSDIKYVLKKLNNRFNSSESTEGLFLLEGLKGSGKSHLELLIYHLLENSDESKNWLAENKINFNSTENLIVSIHKFTDFPFDSIWNIVFEKLDASEMIESGKAPNLDQLRDALSGKQLVLIFDELEMGFESLSNKFNQAQNLSFLQMLSEEAARTQNASVTIFASIYNSNNEPGATLKRVPRVEIKFSESTDRKKVVLHRLFSNYLSLDKSKIDPVVQSFVNHWKKTGIEIKERYIDLFYDSFPFTPEVIDMLFNRALTRNFQANRGPLGLLSRVVQNTYENEDVISLSHFDLTDKRIRNFLLDLDSNQTLVQSAENDFNDLQSIALSKEVINSTLFATLCSSGNIRGINESELAKQVIKPGDNYNDFQASLNALIKLGAYFQHSEDNYFFDTQEKPYAKVEYRSLRVDLNDALNFAFKRWKKIFDDQEAVIFRDFAQVKQELQTKDKNRPRFIYSPHRLDDGERKKIYSGLENQNLVLLLEPKAENFNTVDDHDIIKWAQLALAAEELKNTANDSDRKRQYEKIENENTKHIEERFKTAGLFYVLVRKTNGDLVFELESLGQAYTKQDIIDFLKKNFFPKIVFEEHLKEHIEKGKETGKNWIIGNTIKNIFEHYKKTLSFPVLLAEDNFYGAVKNLCVNRIIGLDHTKYEPYCGRLPYFQPNEWLEVKVTEPHYYEKTDPGIFSEQQESTKKEKAEISIEEELTTANAHNISKQDTIHSTNTTSIGELRQNVAERLNDKEDFQTTEIRFNIHFEKDSVDLSSLPTSLRGTFTGDGDLLFELTITKKGNFDKAQIEQLVEQLPVYQNAFYKATLKGFIKEKESIDER